MQDRGAYRPGMAEDEAKRDHPRKRGAKDCRGRQAEPLEQRRGVVRLLLGRGRSPARRSGTPSVATPVIGDDRELIREQFGEPLEVPGVAGCAHDQEKRGTGASDLVVKLGAVDLKHVISLCDRALSISRLSWASGTKAQTPIKRSGIRMTSTGATASVQCSCKPHESSTRGARHGRRRAGHPPRRCCSPGVAQEQLDPAD